MEEWIRPRLGRKRDREGGERHYPEDERRRKARAPTLSNWRGSPPHNPDPKRPTKELMELLKINLTRNDFEFNEEYFLQIKGTAMGKKFAPSYTNRYMSIWEKEALAKCTHSSSLRQIPR